MFSDILDINFDLSSIKWRQLERTSRLNIPSLIEGVLRLFYFGGRSLTKFNPFWGATDVIFLVGTQNNLNAITPVLKKLDLNAKVLSYHDFEKQDGVVPEFYFYIMGLLTSYKYLFSYFYEANRYQKWVMRKRFDRYIFSCSSVFIWKRLLKLNKTKLVVISNDHSAWTRSAIKAAKELNIATAFIPHAPTGNDPAPLDYSVAFLDGVIQEMQYDNKGTNVVLSGAIRYEEMVYKTRNKDRDRGNGILVCFNKLDSIQFISKILSSVKENLNCKVVVRPHPADKLRFDKIKEICTLEKCMYSDPFDSFYTSAIGTNTILAGVSGAHLDGLMMGMIPVTLEGWYEGDYYRLKERKLLVEVKTVENLSTLDVDINHITSKLYEYNIHCSNPKKLPSEIVRESLFLMLKSNKNKSNRCCK